VAGRVIGNPIINSPYRASARRCPFDHEVITKRVDEYARPSSSLVSVRRPRKRSTQPQLELTAAPSERTAFVDRVRALPSSWVLHGDRCDLRQPLRVQKIPESARAICFRASWESP